VLRFVDDADTDPRGFDPQSFAWLAELEEQSFWFRGRNRVILNSLQDAFPRAGSVLEVGCGTGYVMTGISAELPSVSLTGADLYLEALRYARRRLPSAQLIQCDATSLPFDREFDVVGAFDVLEHVDDDEAVLAGLHRAVQPGGGLIATVPQHSWLWSPADEFALHRRRYTRREFVSKVQRAGFKPRIVTSFVFTLLPLMLLSRLQARRSEQPFDPLREHRNSRRLNAPLERMLKLEANLIRRGVSLPIGGSLLIVAERL
jgi:SAM-dependent methyltransferase